MRGWAIHALRELPEGIGRLRAEAAREGFRFMDKLIFEWQRDINRFDRPGELFLGAFDGTDCVGVCGLNRDPYIEPDGVGRLRHLYVRQDLRRYGIASALLRRQLDHARHAFTCVRLRTDGNDAARFYQARGFVAINDETATHICILDSGSGTP